MATIIATDHFTEQLSEARLNAEKGWPTVIKDDVGKEYVLLTRSRYLKLITEGPTLFEASSAMDIPGLADISDEVWDSVINRGAGAPKSDAS